MVNMEGRKPIVPIDQAEFDEYRKYRKKISNIFYQAKLYNKGFPDITEIVIELCHRYKKMLALGQKLLPTEIESAGGILKAVHSAIEQGEAVGQKKELKDRTLQIFSQILTEEERRTIGL